MVGVAKRPKAPDCGSGIRGFESHHPPQKRKRVSLLGYSFQSVKELPIHPRFWYNKGNGGVIMEQWRKDARKEPIIILRNAQRHSKIRNGYFCLLFTFGAKQREV